MRFRPGCLGRLTLRSASLFGELRLLGVLLQGDEARRMKVSLLIGLLLLAFASHCKAVRVKLTLRNFLLNTDDTIIEIVINTLFMNYDIYLNFILSLALCDYFDFNPFMPRDPNLLKPPIDSLRKINCPREIEERLYNFYALQDSEEGKKFLLDANANFARHGWRHDSFTFDEVQNIMLSIKASPPSQIKHLDIDVLLYVIQLDKSGFFSKNGCWNLFPISSFPITFIDSKALRLWFEQVKSQAAKDDLLFYRLAYLYWYYQIVHTKLVSQIKELLAEFSSASDFKRLVFNHFSQEKYSKKLRPLIEIPNFILEDNTVAQATLHFEHFFAAFEMGYEVDISNIISLFQKFKPSLISPLICKKLLEWLDYKDFVSVLEASPRWKRKYGKVYQGDLYFPPKFLSAETQAKIWRYQTLRIEKFPNFNNRLLFLNHPTSWRKYIEYKNLTRWIAVEQDGFTLIDYRANEKSVIEFIEGRIVDFLLYGRSLPKFIPILQKYGQVIDIQKYDGLAKGNFCITMALTKQPLTQLDISGLPTRIESVFTRWRVPLIFWASL